MRLFQVRHAFRPSRVRRNRFKRLRAQSVDDAGDAYLLGIGSSTNCIFIHRIFPGPRRYILQNRCLTGVIERFSTSESW